MLITLCILLSQQVTIEPTFSKFVSEVIRAEGAHTYHPRDPGGETKFGISQRSYPDLDIANLSESAAAIIYYRDYWRGPGLDQLPAPIAYMVFDFGVNAGPLRAIRTLQALVEVEVDGKIGPKTIAAVQEAYTRSQGHLLQAYTASRLDFYNRLPHCNVFCVGWHQRTQDVWKLATYWALRDFS